MTKVLIIYGGWPGHSPKEISYYLSEQLESIDYHVTLVDALNILNDYHALRNYDLIVMNWTRGEIIEQAIANLQQVISEGCGLAGIHGGLTSAFQNSKQWQFLTGGLFVDHPGGLEQHYTVTITDTEHAITQGVSDFSVQTEQYYLLVDPAVHILANTTFATKDHPNAMNPSPISLPVAWVKNWGKGHIFYHSFGHDLATCQLPMVEKLTLQGFQWACRTTTE